MSKAQKKNQPLTKEQRKKSNEILKIRCLSTLTLTTNLNNTISKTLMKQFQLITKIKPLGSENINLCPYIDFIHGKQGNFLFIHF